MSQGMEPPDATQTTKDYVSARNTTTYAFVAERSKAVHSSCTVFVHASSNLVECTSFAPLSYVRATHLLILRQNNHTFADSSGKRHAMPYDHRPATWAMVATVSRDIPYLPVLAVTRIQALASCRHHHHLQQPCIIDTKTTNNI